uniref:Ovule protein n=1 Tax=Steinernema glaseri TaxID=37863 RepID=A0A1I7Y052_9BILA
MDTRCLDQPGALSTNIKQISYQKGWTQFIYIRVYTTVYEIKTRGRISSERILSPNVSRKQVLNASCLGEG